MAWYLQPVPVTSGIDWLTELLRMAIADPKQTINQVTMEAVSELASGVPNETFYTEHLPIASGFETYMRVGRWYYEEVETTADAQDKRAYVFNVESGAFMIPSGAILAESGSQVYLSYSWLEEQSYSFSDYELRLYLQDAVTEVNQGIYNFGHTTSGMARDFDIIPAPGANDVASYVYVKYAAYLIKKRQEAEGLDNRIYVRDLNVTIDTAKGLGDLSKSAETLRKEIDDIITNLRLKGQESAFARIDTYSTYAYSTFTGKYDKRWNKDSDFYRYGG